MSSQVDAPAFPLIVNGEIDGELLSGTVTQIEGRYWFESETQWSGRTQPGSRAAMRKEFRGRSPLGKIYIAGTDFHRDGQQLLQIDDLRIGCEEPDSLVIRAVVNFQYADQVSRYYSRDGAERSPRRPLRIPPLEGAPEMELVFTGARVELTALAPTRLEYFETQMETFRRLLTFATQRATAQLSFAVETEQHSSVNIYARSPTVPSKLANVDYRDFPIRLGNENAQHAINQWWSMTEKLRPIPQTLTGVLTQPGFVESDFLFLATVLDRLGEEWIDAPKPLTPAEFKAVTDAIAALGLQEAFPVVNTSPFAKRLEAVASLLPDGVWSALQVEKSSWLKSLRHHRNLVAHSDEQRARHRKFMTGNGLRALRDANIAIVTLLISQHLGVSNRALIFAAERQRYRWVQLYTHEELVFTNSGIQAGT